MVELPRVSLATKAKEFPNLATEKGAPQPDCIIVFTDGYVESDWGGTAWPAPVLWCVSTKRLTAPTGKTLYVPA